MTDARSDDTDFHYWLYITGFLSNNSPLIIVSNEKSDRKSDIPEKQLRATFGHLQSVICINLANNRGLRELIQTLEVYLCQLPHVGSTLPKTWTKVRTTLELLLLIRKDRSRAEIVK